MNQLNKIDLSSDKPAGASLLIILGFILISMVLGNIIATGIMFYASDTKFNMSAMINLTSNLMAAKNGWLGLMIAQGLASLITFIFGAMAYWRWMEHKSLSDFNFVKSPQIILFLLAFLIQICLLPFNGWLQEINANMKLPSILSDLESVLKGMEESMAELTKFITNFDEIWELVLAVLVIGVIAGIGEELLFRGLVQRKIYLATHNPHIAIWISAIIFSAIHFQFYGFLPRMFLGAMFGYFYFYSGNLWIPICAHIFNNSLAVFMMYLVNLKKISPEIEKLDTVPFYGIVLSLSLATLLIFNFRKISNFKIQ
jgi:membrane protease YdiL (CAAX protease family)